MNPQVKLKLKPRKLKNLSKAKYIQRYRRFGCNPDFKRGLCRNTDAEAVLGFLKTRLRRLFKKKNAPRFSPTPPTAYLRVLKKYYSLATYLHLISESFEEFITLRTLFYCDIAIGFWDTIKIEPIIPKYNIPHSATKYSIAGKRVPVGLTYYLKIALANSEFEDTLKKYLILRRALKITKQDYEILTILDWEYLNILFSKSFTFWFPEAYSLPKLYRLVRAYSSFLQLRALTPEQLLCRLKEDYPLSPGNKV